MNSRLFKSVFGAALIAFTASSFAAPGAIEVLQTAITTSLDKIFSQLQTIAVKWLGLFMLVQMIWTHSHQLISGADLEKVWAKMLGSFFWFGIAIYIFNNGPDFIKNTATYLIGLATGTTGTAFDPMSPINRGINAASILLETLDGSSSIVGLFNPFPAIMMGLVSLVILGVSALLAFKIFMIILETKMVIALSPLSFSLLGLNAFKDQGFAPLKYLVSMAIRMFLIGAILSAMVIFSETIVASFKALPPASDPSVWPSIWAAAIGYVLLGAITLRVDSIAAMLASGSSQMSGGDAAAVGAIAGAAAGVAAAAATGGAALAAKIPGAMPSAAGSIKNGGSGGRDSGPLLSPPVSPASMSKAPENPLLGTTRDPAFLKTDGSAAANKQTSGPNLDADPGSGGAGGADGVGTSGAGAASTGGNGSNGTGGATGGSNANAGGNAASGSGMKSEIGSPERPTEQKEPNSTIKSGTGVLEKLMAPSRDRKSLADHVFAEAPAVHISMNTHQGD